MKSVEMHVVGRKKSMNGAMWVGFEVRSKIYLEAPPGYYTIGSCPILFHRLGKELVVNMDLYSNYERNYIK